MSAVLRPRTFELDPDPPEAILRPPSALMSLVDSGACDCFIVAEVAASQRGCLASDCQMRFERTELPEKTKVLRPGSLESLLKDDREFVSKLPVTVYGELKHSVDGHAAYGVEARISESMRMHIIDALQGFDYTSIHYMRIPLDPGDYDLRRLDGAKAQTELAHASATANSETLQQGSESSDPRGRDILIAIGRRVDGACSLALEGANQSSGPRELVSDWLL